MDFGVGPLIASTFSHGHESCWDMSTFVFPVSSTIDRLHPLEENDLDVQWKRKLLKWWRNTAPECCLFLRFKTEIRYVSMVLKYQGLGNQFEGLARLKMTQIVEQTNRSLFRGLLWFNDTNSHFTLCHPVALAYDCPLNEKPHDLEQPQSMSINMFSAARNGKWSFSAHIFQKKNNRKSVLALLSFWVSLSWILQLPAETAFSEYYSTLFASKTLSHTECSSFIVNIMPQNRWIIDV